MKRINAQWVFLIILALWIPVLCFADETVEPEQETVVEETMVVSDNFGPPYEPEESSLAFIIWAGGVIAFGAVGSIFGIISALIMLFYSFKLNYHLYIEHGEFAFWFSGEQHEGKERRRNIIKDHFKKGSDVDDADMLGWWCCWIFMALGSIFIAAGALIWPILIVGLAPFFLVRAVAFNKRRKKVFQDKLKGNETNGIV